MMLFKNFSLRLQIVIPLTIAILAGVGVSLLIGFQVTKEQQLVSNIYAEALDAWNSSHSAAVEFAAAEEDVTRMLSMASFISANDVEKNFKAHDAIISRALTKLMTNNLSDEIGAKAVELRDTYKAWKASAQIILGMQSSQFTPTMEKLRREHVAVFVVTDQLQKLVSRTAQAKTRAANIALNRSIKFELIALTIIGFMTVLGSWLIASNIAQPIHEVTGIMNKLAKGRSNIILPPQKFAAEINSMVSVLDIFQQNVIQVKRMNAEKRFEEEKNMEMLRILRETSVSLTNASDDIRAASNDFSERTKHQAISVEETAAAVFEITESVKIAETRAEDAGRIVARTKHNAESSSLIVNAAIEAMDEINGSSRKIENIIGVIDKISFQTNLLALNAGVEAARAGNAGRGFAVVAQEIRDLAQRSANSSREIKELITTSGKQVKNGVELVNKTGAALTSIGTDIEEVNGHVAAIVVTAREQSLTLQDINSSIGKIDEGTRQNAVMVEQSVNATNALADELIIIDRLISRIEIADKEEVGQLEHASPHKQNQDEGKRNQQKAA